MQQARQLPAAHGSDGSRRSPGGRGPSPARDTSAAPVAGSPTGAQILRLQRSAGNAAVRGLLAQRATPTSVQRQPAPPAGFALTGLTVAGANAFGAAGDSFVTIRGGFVTVTATVTSATGAPLPPRTLRWAGGAAGATGTQRLVRQAGQTTVRATLGGTTRTVHVHIVTATVPPAANAAATRQHLLAGRANPGGNFGLTVVTIGQQGVRGPTFVVSPHFDVAGWVFRVSRIQHRFKVGVNGQGRRDITGPGSVRPATLAAVVTDLTPPGPGAANGPPRTRFWNQRITQAHEQAHVDRFYTGAAFWPAAMGRFETTVETTRVPFDPATARTGPQVTAARRAGFQTSADTEHGVADAAEIGGSEPVAHGVSNPMYTALLAGIVAAVRPPAPTGLTATPGATSVTLNWALAAGVTTGSVVERATGRGGFTQVIALGPGVLTFTDGGLAAGTRFRYRVSAVGTAGRSAAASVTARTP